MRCCKGFLQTLSSFLVVLGIPQKISTITKVLRLDLKQPPRFPPSSCSASTFVLSREHPLEGEGHRVPAAGQLQAALVPLAAHGLQRHHQVTTRVWEGTQQ